jgi:hypothetical protein
MSGALKLDSRAAVQHFNVNRSSYLAFNSPKTPTPFVVPT